MEAEVVTQVMGREGTTITIQTTVDLSGSMLAVEDAILASVNEVGVIATQEWLKRFDGDGDPIVLGGIKWYSRAAEEKTYRTPYGGYFCPSPKKVKLVERFAWWDLSGLVPKG